MSLDSLALVDAGVEVGYTRVDNGALKAIADLFGIDVDVPVDQFRLGFLNGRFELFPYHFLNETWLAIATSVERQLAHGTYTWDKLNLWGLSVNQTNALRWLAPGKPRRVFMAGGSDAHGDLNYRREGYFFGTTAIVDAAIGKPRNLVQVRVGPAREARPDADVLAPLSRGERAQSGPGAHATRAVLTADTRLPSRFTASALTRSTHPQVAVDPTRPSLRSADELLAHAPAQEQVVDAIARGLRRAHLRPYGGQLLAGPDRCPPDTSA